MPCAAENGQKPGRQRRKNRNVLRIAAKKLLCILQHDSETTRRLQEARAGDDRKDDEHDVDRRFARLIAKDKGKDDEADTADSSKTETAMSYTNQKTEDQNDETQQHFHKIRPFSF